jgi:hypothetical protein
MDYVYCIIGWLQIRSWGVDKIDEGLKAAFNLPMSVLGDEGFFACSSAKFRIGMGSLAIIGFS